MEIGFSFFQALVWDDQMNSIASGFHSFLRCVYAQGGHKGLTPHITHIFYWATNMFTQLRNTLQVYNHHSQTLTTLDIYPSIRTTHIHLADPMDKQKIKTFIQNQSQLSMTHTKHTNTYIPSLHLSLCLSLYLTLSLLLSLSLYL